MLHYWTFPPQGISALLPSNAQRSDLTIRQYLNISAAYPPTNGFGLIAPYSGDIIQLEWPTDDYISLERSWHCMPCQQTNLHNHTHEEFDWESCIYEESPPRLFTLPLTLDKTIKSSPSLFHTTKFTLTWPYTIESNTLLCTFIIPGTFPHGLSTAFPFINTAPPVGREQHIFAADAVRGVEVQGYPHGKAGRGSVFGFLAVVLLLGGVVVGALVGRRFFIGKVAGMLKVGIEGARRRG
ncbi:hypothetical protein T440DRAFT_368951, partial [Plenodomus tracheiphilus IPT5]